ncbi:hypothetical protein [Pseudomonas sp. Q1-7]|uniref:hypothetical protein n=1 Tax=Pseudomonas sp. Q1-7 TaxID=3020843 RepID=UPI002300072C|nr:hypothetical protein [Pseudomonas sp. Q1-7]
MRKKIIALALLLTPFASNANEALSAQDLAVLCKHDLLSAKIIIVNETRDGYALAKLLLKRGSACNSEGEVDFYSAVVGSRIGDFDYGSSNFVTLMRKSAGSGYPLAIAQLHKLGTEGYTNLGGDPNYYKKLFEEEKNKNKDDYPEFDVCLHVLKKMLRNGH